MHNPKERIEVQQLFSIKDCLSNPNKLYIFGDNLAGIGKGGQAVIRDCPNTFGIPTKRFPSMSSDSFFSDKGREEEEIRHRLSSLYNYYMTGVFYKTTYVRKKSILVFPSNGLGTGLSKMPTKSPKLYKLMNDLIYEYFGVCYE